MVILTQAIIKKLEATPLYTHDETPPEKIPVIMKLFFAFSNWTWYVTEGSKQEDGDWLFFGYVEGFENELGYFALSELAGIKKFGLGLERDTSYDNTVHYLSEVMKKR